MFSGIRLGESETIKKENYLAVNILLSFPSGLWKSRTFSWERNITGFIYYKHWKVKYLAYICFLFISDLRLMSDLKNRLHEIRLHCSIMTWECIIAKYEVCFSICWLQEKQWHQEKFFLHRNVYIVSDITRATFHNHVN